MKNGEHRKTGKAEAWHKGGLHVLHLQGSLKEMAAQHGSLLKPEIHAGALPYLGQKNAHLLKTSHLFKNHPRAAAAVLKLIHLGVHKPMLAHVPRHYLEEAHAIAKAADVPYAYCEEAMVHADTLVILLRHFLGKHVWANLSGGFPGCTSVVATGEMTASKGIMHARNMDYPTVGRWDTQPAVFFCDPTGDDKGQRYVGVSSAGIHTSGVTAVNESGLSLASHFHCAKATSVFGTPIQFIGAEIARKARTIGQAVDIASNFERAATWSIIVTSARENDAVVIEMVHGRLEVREPKDGLLVHTNNYHTPEFQSREVLLSASQAKDCENRLSRAQELAEKSRGRVELGTLARILGDHHDVDTGTLRSQATTISVVTTVTSMITELAQGRFWVANWGRSPVCLGDYTGFRVDESFENFGSREPEIFSWSTQAATTIRGTPKEEAFQIFRDAYIAFHTEYDLAKAAECAERAAKADPDEGHFHLAHGHFRMRLGQPQRALEAFQTAATCALSPHMQQTVKLLLGHAHDCLGHRNEAVGYYSRITQAIDPKLSAEARRCLKKAYSTERAERITFDLQYCDSFEYA